MRAQRWPSHQPRRYASFDPFPHGFGTWTFFVTADDGQHDLASIRSRIITIDQVSQAGKEFRPEYGFAVPKGDRLVRAEVPSDELRERGRRGKGFSGVHYKHHQRV